MSERVTLQVAMELLSDTILGSGFSIPGGEDISVCKDNAGWPFLKGSTFKGLLRESAENWLSWTGGSEEQLNAVFGESGWSGADDGRKLHLTGLTLSNPPAKAEDCFATRAFTSVENGTAKDGTLRLAQCIVSGLRFEGSVSCISDDIELIQSALAAIKWVGTMRSRGFGLVRFTSGIAKAERNSANVEGARCIRYRLHTETPVLITDLNRSSGNSYETRGYIPGSAIRGMVVSNLAVNQPEWFREHRVELLSESTRFLDAVPILGEYAPLPSIRGFYEGKQESGEIESVLRSGDFTPGYKRAKLGSFCSIDGDTLRYWNAASGGSTRIKLGASGEDTEMFQTRHLDAGQDFEGYILLDESRLSAHIAACFAKTVWLGADRYSGYGKCAVTVCEASNAPRWITEYGIEAQSEVSETLYMLAISPLSMRNDVGEACGIDTARLAQRLGVDTVDIPLCSTSTSEYGGYNRTWRSRSPAAQMYDRGSVFKLVCDRAPSVEAIRVTEETGLGIRRAEGYGQVLFIDTERFESIKVKAHLGSDPGKAGSDAAALRRARYRWVMDHASVITASRLSRSQVGTIQSLCEKTLANHGDWNELKGHLEKNLNDRGAQHGERFKRINVLVNDVMDHSMSEMMGVSCDNSDEEKLKLLILLFDFSRKNLGKEDT